MKLKGIDENMISNQIVYLRCDFNVSFLADNSFDTFRIDKAIPTIKLLLKNNNKIILLSHLGRPKGVDEKFSLKKTQSYLEEILNEEILFCESFKPESIKRSLERLDNRNIILVENTRFNKLETEYNNGDIKSFTDLGDIFVNDAFATIHRKHLSTYGLGTVLPAYSGLLIKEEINKLDDLLSDNVDSPFLVIISGAKAKTKIPLIEHFIGRADNIFIAGGIAHTFLKSQGYKIGSSIYEEDYLEIAKNISLKANNSKTNIVLPIDCTILNHQGDVMVKEIKENNILDGENMYDIGKRTFMNLKELINNSHTILWNGPVGKYEDERFSEKTNLLANEIANNKNTHTIIGGGDTITVINNLDISHNSFYHISTGGGAMLEYLSGKKLAGLELLKKDD